MACHFLERHRNVFVALLGKQTCQVAFEKAEIFSLHCEFSLYYFISTPVLQKDLQIGKKRIGTFHQPVGNGVGGHVTPPVVRVRVRVILLEVSEAGNARVGTLGKGLSRRFWEDI
ncbi:hypothetical protein AVEN_252498-1 [Araneus ventricosus]|uniref:Uncharacterized protein n=1 Tax=Araneus ventricosus TaxID=182803 RepID=A0A4Y2AS70_ARAVE|nr:hypothetical protein AVEN_252498-1 [Araneus ventricosus]